MMNIQSAIAQCRIARRQGKISNQVQQRTLRRLNGPGIMGAHWQKMLKLRITVDRDVAPQMEAIKQAETIMEAPANRFARFKEKKVAQVKNRKEGRKLTTLSGPEYTPEWFRKEGGKPCQPTAENLKVWGKFLAKYGA